MSFLKGIKNALITPESTITMEELNETVTKNEVNYIPRTTDGSTQSESDSLTHDIEASDGYIVDAIYEKASLSDRSKSIYMVDSYAKSLPTVMMDSVKVETVNNILSAAGLRGVDLLDDAIARINALSIERDLSSEEYDEATTAVTLEIEQLKARIAALQETQRNNDDTIHNQCSTIDREIALIESLRSMITI